MVARAVINASRMNGRHAAMEGKPLPTTTQVCRAPHVACTGAGFAWENLFAKGVQWATLEWVPPTIYPMRSARPNS